MKAKIVEKPAQFFRVVKGVIKTPSAELPVGTELDCGDVLGAKVFSGRQCVPARLSDGRRGYIFADTMVVRFKEVALATDRVPLYRGPSFDTGVVAKLGKYTQALIVETQERDGKQWNKIRGLNGSSRRKEGYVEQVTPVRIVPPRSKAAGRQCLLVALRWWVVAIGIGVVGYAYDLGAIRTCIVACVPLFYALRFTLTGVWHQGAAI